MGVTPLQARCPVLSPSVCGHRVDQRDGISRRVVDGSGCGAGACPKDWVTRRRWSEDRRAVSLTLSRKGEAFVRTIAHVVEGLEAKRPIVLTLVINERDLDGSLVAKVPPWLWERDVYNLEGEWAGPLVQPEAREAHGESSTGTEK